jgi:hypothetical protein
VEDDRIWALTSHARKQGLLDDLSPGSVVTLDDTEGRTVNAVIESVAQNGLMELRLIWETWLDVSAVHLSPLHIGGFVSTPLVQNPQRYTSAPELVNA